MAAVTGKSSQDNKNLNVEDEKKSDESLKKEESISNKYLSIMHGDLWLNDKREQTLKSKKVTRLSSSNDGANPVGIQQVQNLISFMTGGTGTSAQLWTGNGVDTGNGISPDQKGNTFERKLLFATYGATPGINVMNVINPARNGTRNGIAFNIPTAQNTFVVSTRYSSKLVSKDGTAISPFLIDDSFGYWIFDITTFVNSVNSNFPINTYYCLTNFHGVTITYGGTLNYDSSNNVFIATLSAPNSNLSGTGISNTLHLEPYNSLANSQYPWNLTVTFNIDYETQKTMPIVYSRTGDAHPANINFNKSAI